MTTRKAKAKAELSEFPSVSLSERYIAFSYEDGRRRYTECLAWAAKSGAYVRI
jgi:hypothetical protein